MLQLRVSVPQDRRTDLAVSDPVGCHRGRCTQQLLSDGQSGSGVQTGSPEFGRPRQPDHSLDGQLSGKITVEGTQPAVAPRRVTLFGQPPVGQFTDAPTEFVVTGTGRQICRCGSCAHRALNSGTLRSAAARTPSAKSAVSRSQACSLRSWSVAAMIWSTMPCRKVLRMLRRASGAAPASSPAKATAAVLICS